MRNKAAFIVLLMLSLFGARASHAAYCVQVITLTYSYLAQTKSQQVVVPASQPSDKTTCSNVLLSGAELASLYAASAAAAAVQTDLDTLEGVVTDLQALVASGGGGSSDPFNPDLASGVFGFFFISIVALFLLAKNIGLILEAIKRW